MLGPQFFPRFIELTGIPLLPSGALLSVAYRIADEPPCHSVEVELLRPFQHRHCDKDLEKVAHPCRCRLERYPTRIRFTCDANDRLRRPVGAT